MDDHQNIDFQPMGLFRYDLTRPELRFLYGAIWTLAWPAFFAQGVRSIVMFIVRVIVSQLGETAYNSVSIGMRVFMLIITVIGVVAVGTVALVSQSWGAGDRAKAGRMLQQSLIWGFLLSLVIAVLGVPLTTMLFHLLGADAPTMAAGSIFMHWLFAAAPLIAPGFFLAAGLRAAGDTKTPMVAAVIMALTALLLSYGLVLGKLGMPRLEILGAALAIGGAFSCFTLFLAVLFITNRTILKLPRRGWRPDFGIGKSMFRIGGPAALQMMMVQLGMLIFIFVIYDFGKEAVAGYFTGMAIFVFAQAPCQGFMVASATLVGQAVGARDYRRAENVFRHAALLSFSFMIVIGSLVYVLATPTNLGLLFSKLTPESMGHARDFIVILVLAMPLMGVAFSTTGGLRGAGDTVPPMIASTTGMYGGRILGAFIMVSLFHAPVWLVWCAMFPDYLLRILVMAVRLKSGKWKRPKI